MNLRASCAAPAVALAPARAALAAGLPPDQLAQQRPAEDQHGRRDELGPEALEQLRLGVRRRRRPSGPASSPCGQVDQQGDRDPDQRRSARRRGPAASGRAASGRSGRAPRARAAPSRRGGRCRSSRARSAARGPRSRPRPGTAARPRRCRGSRGTGRRPARPPRRRRPRPRCRRGHVLWVHAAMPARTGPRPPAGRSGRAPGRGRAGWRSPQRGCAPPRTGLGDVAGRPWRGR